ncbi:hypothetical protein SH661x_000981 [Planctomicrobium sp. SH661]|uniref:hypothetical protein n=1 Tax=Planctomicrobium sp. SH661 TaxID=3448124 RepID=UPI003F5BEDDD
MTKRFRLLVLVNAALFVAGCGEAKDPHKLDVVSASGTLSIPDMQVGNLSLLFVPDDQKLTNAWSRVGENGQFQVSTYEEGDGIAVGNYTVYISGGVGAMPDEDNRLSKIPARYHKADASPWKIEVSSDPKMNVFILDVK